MGIVSRSVILALGASAKVAEISAMQHDVQQVYPQNFDNIIGTSLPLTVSSVLYYKGSSSEDAAFIEEYNKVAVSMKKKIKVVALDCEEAAAKKHCERVNVQATPHVHLYPKTPQPHFKYEGKMEADAIVKRLTKMIPDDKVTLYNSKDDFKAWKAKSHTKPKIMFVSENKKMPSLVKALSTDTVFARTVEFGYLPVDKTTDDHNSEILKEVKGEKKNFPAVLMMFGKKSTWYSSKDFSYLALHDWINVNSESGMGDTVKGSGASEVSAEEPEYEKVRELHTKSQNELCFKQKNVCAVYLSNGPLDDKAADMINGFESTFEPKTDRGIKFAWMWLDVSQETHFKAILDKMEKTKAQREDRDEEPLEYPTMVFVKPPKKKRDDALLSYTKMSNGPVTESSVADIVETISGGTTYIRADMPTPLFVQRSKKPAKKTEL